MASPLASTSRLRLGNSLSIQAVVASRAPARHSSSTSSVPPASVFSSEEPSFTQDDSPLASSASSIEDPISLEQVQSQDQNQRPQYEDPRKLALEAERATLRLRSISLRNLESTGSGSTQTRATAFRPHKLRLNPIAAQQLTVSHLLAATAQVGHRLSSLNRAASAFVYGKRHGVAIIDVEKHTLPAMKRAAAVVRDVTMRDGVVLFLGTGQGTQRAILDAAKRLGKNGYHVTMERWMPGVITNAPKLLGRAILGDMEAYAEGMQEQQQRQQQQQQQNSSGNEGPRDRDNRRPAEPDASTLASQVLVPDLVVVLNPKANVHAIREATERGIPTVAITDTDVDPRIVTYAIPANDESTRTAELVLGVLSRAGQEGLQRRSWLKDQHEKAKHNARRISDFNRQQHSQEQQSSPSPSLREAKPAYTFQPQHRQKRYQRRNPLEA